MEKPLHINNYNRIGTIEVRLFTDDEILQIDQENAEYEDEAREKIIKQIFSNLGSPEYESEVHEKIVELIDGIFSNLDSPENEVVLATKTFNGTVHSFSIRREEPQEWQENYAYITIDNIGEGYDFSDDNLPTLAYYWGVTMDEDMVAISSRYDAEMTDNLSPAEQIKLEDNKHAEHVQYAREHTRRLIAEFIRLLIKKLKSLSK